MSWQPPSALPDLRRVGIIALDTETNDEGLRADRGSAWPWRGGYVCGVSVAWHGESGICGSYIPLRHPDSENFERENVIRWLKDLFASDVRIVTQNGLYDYGWIFADFGLQMPPSERLEEIGALATLIDENRFSYSLDALCAWRELPGKDTALVRRGGEDRRLGRTQTHHQHRRTHLQAAGASGRPLRRSRCDRHPGAVREPEPDPRPRRHPRRLSARRRSIADGARDAPARHSRRPGRRRTGARLLPAETRPCARRAIGQARRAHEHGRDRVAEMEGAAHSTPTGSAIRARRRATHRSRPASWDGWARITHWLPQLIATANKYDDAGAKFLEGHILAHLVGDRIYAEINPHRSENGGTRSFRFSYSAPPLQQMPSRDEELGAADPQRLPAGGGRDVVHGRLLAAGISLRRASRLHPQSAGREGSGRALPQRSRYRLPRCWRARSPRLPRKDAKDVNFAKIYGAGVKKFAEMIGKPLNEAQAIYAQYDRLLPFIAQLAAACPNRSQSARLHAALRWRAPTLGSLGAQVSLRQRRRPVLARGSETAHPRSRASLV